MIRECPHCGSRNTERVYEKLKAGQVFAGYHWHCNDCGKDFEACTH